MLARLPGEGRFRYANLFIFEHNRMMMMTNGKAAAAAVAAAEAKWNN